MSKQLIMELNGEKRTLEFGKFYFLKFYGEATGEDPLNTSQILLKPEKMFDFACALVFAGLRTEYKMNKLPFTITREEVEDWVGELDSSTVSKFIEDYVALNKTEGEVQPELNGQSHGMS